jgi:hypothetical protein
MRLAQMVKLWCKVHDVEYRTLAREWGASNATVTRFLAGEQTPNGETVAKIIAWLFDEQRVPQKPKKLLPHHSELRGILK